MLLCDNLMIAADLLRRSPLAAPSRHTPVYSAHIDQFEDLAGRLRNARRYILDDAVVEAACHVVLSRPSSILEAARHLRIPLLSMWVEWNDDARRAMRMSLGITVDNAKPPPKRFGFLITSDLERLAGRVEYAWKHSVDSQLRANALMTLGCDIDPDDGCVVSNVCNNFDFRALDTQYCHEGLPDDGVMKRWANRPEELEACRYLDNALLIGWTESGGKMLDACAAMMPEDVDQIRADWLEDLDGEFFQVLSTVILLTARNGTETRDVVPSPKLNRARAAKGKPPLLEHRITTMRLSPGEVRSSRGGAAGLSAVRRAHLVCGHYVVRGGKVFWRRSHMRGGKGTGPDRPKTIRVVM